MRFLRKTSKRLLHWVIGLALLPLLAASIHQLGLMLPSLGQEGWRAWWIYALGAGVYIILELIFHKPMWVYVFGHEMTHAISGILSGARLLKFKATAKGGEVQLSKSNVFVALSPYVVPIYMAMVVGAYALLRIWIKAPALTYAFQFFLGLTLAFHLSLTFMALHRRQPDLKILGYFLSTALIWLGNTLILTILCISLFKKTPSFQQHGLALWEDTLKLSKLALVYAMKGADFLYTLWTRLHIR